MIDNDILNKVIKNEIDNRLNFSLDKDVKIEFSKLKNNELEKETFVFLYTLICWTDRDNEVINNFLSLYIGNEKYFTKYFWSHTIIKYKKWDYKTYKYFFDTYKEKYLFLSKNWTLINKEIWFIETFNKALFDFSSINLLIKQLWIFDFIQNLYLFWVYNISPNENDDLQYIIDMFNNKYTKKTKKIFNYNELKEIVLYFAKKNYWTEDYKKILNIIWYIVEWVYCEYWKELK